MKSFITAILIALFCATPAWATSSEWSSNTFVTPSRNIRCQWYPYVGIVTCMRANDRRQLAVDTHSGRGYEVFTWPDPASTPFTPVLQYNTTFRAPRIQCVSNFNWLACRSSRGHGFQISRTIIKTW